MAFSPFFLTGANAKIKVNHKTLAFVTDLAYGVKIDHATPMVLGMYEPSSIEPLSYRVSGSFTIIRYVAEANKNTTGKPNGIADEDQGNGLGYWGETSFFKNALNQFNFKSPDGRVYENLDPSKLQTATSFEIELRQKTKDGEIGVAKIRGCRITDMNFAINKKTPAHQTFKFEALYLDEDSFTADFSGIGQHFD